MTEIPIPGGKTLVLEHLVADYNGTLAADGRLIPGVADLLRRISRSFQVHVLTADTFGRVRAEMAGLPCCVTVLSKEKQDTGKRRYVRGLGPRAVVCIGNGRNDRLMLREAALGIAVVLGEGAARDAVLAADVVCTDVIRALELLLNPLRLAATLRV
jgi:soluble P-type ATPase